MNNPESTGVAPFPMNNPDGIRMSTALTHLNPVRHRPNLTVRPNALAGRILFDDQRATGVEVKRGDETFTVEGKEILLSAGGVQSPQLLMLSGVGPGDHLNGLGIQVVHHLPGVGQNLRDHPQAAIHFRLKESFPPGHNTVRMQIGLRYTAKGSGARHDMQILAHSFSYPLGKSPSEGLGILLRCILYLAVGSGELRLTSPDPHVQPQLDYRYLTDPWDRERMREAVRLGVRLTEHEAYRDIIAGRIMPNDGDLASDEALDHWLLKNVSTAQHISGTCKMGQATDPLAVVDQYCRVHGLQGLRVVDASVMPDVIRANTNATAIMIAERAADWVRQD